MPYERKTHRLISGPRFAWRLLLHAGISGVLILFSLGLGMAGYMGFENLAWPDAFLNASMILGGMGPVDRPTSEPGKIFAGFYALYCGLVFIAVTGVMIAPVLHRVLHHFHWESSEEPGDDLGAPPKGHRPQRHQ